MALATRVLASLAWKPEFAELEAGSRQAQADWRRKE